MVAVYLPGVSFAIASARPCAKAFHGVPIGLWSERHDHVAALAARRLHETFEPHRSEPLAHLIRGVDQRSPRDILSWIEIEGYPVRRFNLRDFGAPRMDLQDARLDKGDEAVEVLEIKHLIVADVAPLD